MVHRSSDLSSGDQSCFDVMVFYVRIVDKINMITENWTTQRGD